MTKQAEIAFPEQIPAGSLFQKPFNCPRVFREFGLVLDLLRRHVRPRGSVLDLGCGPGWTSLFLSRAGYSVVGLDIAPKMIDIARERTLIDNASAEFLVADVEDFDLGRHDFDGVLFFDSLHHCPNYQAALERSFAHLRPGGCLLLLEPSWLHEWSPSAWAFSRRYGVTELGFSRWHLTRTLRRIGFRPVRHYYDAGPVYSGISGFLLASLRLTAGFLLGYPQLKQIVLARKP